MSEDLKKNVNEDPNEGQREFYPLVDEEGNETLFELVATQTYKGVEYYAFIPAQEELDTEDEETFLEYVILKADEDVDGVVSLSSIDDDDLYDEVADMFDDLFSEEIDYD